MFTSVFHLITVNHYYEIWFRVRPVHLWIFRRFHKKWFEIWILIVNMNEPEWPKNFYSIVNVCLSSFFFIAVIFGWSLANNNRKIRLIVVYAKIQLSSFFGRTLQTTYRVLISSTWSYQKWRHLKPKTPLTGKWSKFDIVQE